ncbi:hypothetical protein EMPS_03772 [Entomortierella parvispora]|uniref:Inhibitor I9 domain-containing protein n=1 Tax=Entomortierella parvispora TaxID=205924 RepID=A0A9P3LUW9_9FUNG|nr:hypothetical protein EMPS_03772 [Entomortierella parvispora]
MTSDNEANAFSASVLPVGTKVPGANTAYPLATAPGTAAKGHGAPAAHNNAMNQVIVVFKANTPKNEIEAAEKDITSQGGEITQRYTTALLGFAAKVPDNAFQSLTLHPQVDYVEADGEVSAYAKNLIQA